jgi:hypothetical protein
LAGFSASSEIVMPRRWEGEGPRFSLEWGGIPWTLDLENGNPGLRDDGIGLLLSLEGLAKVGRTEPNAFSAASLVGIERRFDWVQATYAPAGWSEASVRARWTPWGENGVDLEVQLLTHSVGELQHLEVKMLSRFGAQPSPGCSRSVAPRDVAAAALSYDGRETDMSRLSTSPPAEEPCLWLAPKSNRSGWTYVEMIHPEDASRRIFEGTLPFRVLRTGLFGHDLERGVVLRARARGLWIPKDRAFSESERIYREFLAEPLPLST